jgi:hypothetical protein
VPLMLGVGVFCAVAFSLMRFAAKA